MKIREQLIYPAVAGAAYAALTMLLAPISYGGIQCRLSEALCVLPFFLPSTAWGLFLGCAVANCISAAGILDIVFGSLATLLAGLCTAALGRGWRESGCWPSLGRRIAACLMPVLWNGLVIGAVLSATLMPRDAFWPGFAMFAGQVAAGETIALLLLGLPLMNVLRRRLLPRLGVNDWRRR